MGELTSKVSFTGSETFLENVGIVRADAEVKRHFVCESMELWF